MRIVYRFWRYSEGLLEDSDKDSLSLLDKSCECKPFKIILH